MPAQACYLQPHMDMSFAAEHPEACEHLLNWAGLKADINYDYRELQEQGINLLADTLEAHLDMESLLKLIRI